MSRLTVIIALAILSTLSYAQNDILLFPSANNTDSSSVYSTISNRIGFEGQVNFIHSSGMDSLMVLEKKVNIERGVRGYRVRIFRGNEGQKSRFAAEELKARFLSIFPDGTIYMVYESPNWRILIGDYRTYTAALKKKIELERAMPDLKGEISISSAFIKTTYN